MGQQNTPAISVSNGKERENRAEEMYLKKHGWNFEIFAEFIQKEQSIEVIMWRFFKVFIGSSEKLCVLWAEVLTAFFQTIFQRRLYSEQPWKLDRSVFLQSKEQLFLIF